MQIIAASLISILCLTALNFLNLIESHEMIGANKIISFKRLCYCVMQNLRR